MTDGEAFEIAITQRSLNYPTLSAEEQWAEDKRLGLLDWSGGCSHRTTIACKVCQARWSERFAPKGEPNFTAMTLQEVCAYFKSKKTTNGDRLSQWLAKPADFEDAFHRTEIIWGEKIRGRR